MLKDKLCRLTVLAKTRMLVESITLLTWEIGVSKWCRRGFLYWHSCCRGTAQRVKQGAELPLWRMRTSYLLPFGRQVTSITWPKLAAACQHKTRKRLQPLLCTLQGAVQRLKQGAELLSRRLDQDDQYYSAAAELQKHWKLKVSAAAIATLLAFHAHHLTKWT